MYKCPGANKEVWFLEVHNCTRKRIGVLPFAFDFNELVSATSFTCSTQLLYDADVGSSQKRSRYNKRIDKMRDVEEIEDDLLSKHEGRYTEEQIRMWAHLIQMNKHTSYEEPPNKKFGRHQTVLGQVRGLLVQRVVA